MLLSGYDASSLQEMQEQLLLCNAIVYTPATYQYQALDYSVVTLDGQGILTREARHNVTHIYIEECVEAQVTTTLY